MSATLTKYGLDSILNDDMLFDFANKHLDEFTVSSEEGIIDLQSDSSV